MASGSRDDGENQEAGRPSGFPPPGRKIKGPYVTQCAPGKYAWCRCEKSKRYPYCDGTHRGSEVTPIKVVIDEPKTMVWCACGATNNAPYCDGSHAKL